MNPYFRLRASGSIGWGSVEKKIAFQRQKEQSTSFSVGVTTSQLARSLTRSILLREPNLISWKTLRECSIDGITLEFGTGELR